MFFLLKININRKPPTRYTFLSKSFLDLHRFLDAYEKNHPEYSHLRCHENKNQADTNVNLFYSTQAECALEYQPPFQKHQHSLSFSPYTKILIYTKKIDPNTILMKTFWDATSISDALWLKQFIQRVTSPFSFFISNIKKNGGLRVRAKERVKVKTQNMLCNVLLFTMFLVYFNLFIF